MFARTPQSQLSRTFYPEEEARGSGWFSKGELVVMVLVVLLLLYCWVAGVFPTGGGPEATPAGEQEVAQVTPRSERPLVQIVIRNVKVLPTKSESKGGKAWDVFGGAPDLKVALINRATNSAYYTGVLKDTYSGDFDIAALWVREGDDILVRVIDEDFQFDDPIGEKTVQITPEVIEKGAIELTSFGQVESLRLEVRK
jgi:hypothetical protein